MSNAEQQNAQKTQNDETYRERKRERKGPEKFVSNTVHADIFLQINISDVS